MQVLVIINYDLDLIQTMAIVSAEKKIVDKLVEQCAETVEEVKIAKINLSEDKNKHKCSSCTLCCFQ